MPKILLVEEVEFVIDILQKKLEKEGYEVAVARNIKEGLPKLKDDWPDLVLIDVDASQAGGLEIMEEMNRDPELQGMPVVVIADSNQSIDLKKAIALGAKEWLIKTEFEPPDLIRTIEKLIGK